MSTSSTISILKNDGTIEQVYAHWDGYVSNNGALLLVHYQDPQKVKDLIALGNVSSLNKNVHPSEGSGHDFDKAEKGVTTFYGRDRQEEDQNPIQYKNRKDFFANGDFQGYDYLYKENNQKWYFVDTENTKLKALAPMVKAVAAEMSSELYREYSAQKENAELQVAIPEVEAPKKKNCAKI